MTESVRHWVENELWDEPYFSPDKFGVAQLLVDSQHADSIPRSFWQQLYGRFEKTNAIVFAINEPDNACSILKYVRAISEAEIGSQRLAEFDAFPPEEGGARCLCLTTMRKDRLWTIELDGEYSCRRYLRR